MRRANLILIIFGTILISFLIIFSFQFSTISLPSSDNDETTENSTSSDDLDTDNYILKTQEKLQSDDDFLLMQEKVNIYLKEKDLTMILDLVGDLPNEEWVVNADEENNGLSSIKIYVMVTVYSKIYDGKINMDSYVSRYGFSGSVKEALIAMIHSSSNEATGALILKVGGVSVVNSTIKNYLGENMHFKLSHTPGYAEGGNNRVTMSEEIKIMTLLQNGEILNADYSNQMLDLMYGTNDYFNLKTISGIKSIAQKTAGAPFLQFGVVAKVDSESGRSYLIAIQIWNKNSKNISITAIRDIVEIIQQYFNIEY